MGDIRVLTVDDHALMREGIRRALEEADDIVVVGEAVSAEIGVEKARSVKPDVVVLDNSLPCADGLDMIQTLRRQPGAPKVLMLSFMCDGVLVRQALEAGASGFLVKSDVSASALREAVHAVMSGETRVSPTAANQLARCVAQRIRTCGSALTPRERQIWQMLAEGLRNRDIAFELRISERTVKFHVSNILRKLMVSSRTEAAALAYSSHFISTE